MDPLAALCLGGSLQRNAHRTAPPPKAVLLYDFLPQSQREVAVLAGDVVDCVAIDADRKWLYVRTLRNTVGYVPTAYCRFLTVVPSQPQSQPQPQPQQHPARTVETLSQASGGEQYSSASLDRRQVKRVQNSQIIESTPVCWPVTVSCGQNARTVSPSLADSRPVAVPADRTHTTLASPCSIASASSGVSTGGTDFSHVDASPELADDYNAFSRTAVAQYGSASGSSSCSSACERRIKMIKTNEQRQKMLRTKSVESVGDASDASSRTVNSCSDKLVDMLWSQTLRKHIAAVGPRRPTAAVRALCTTATVRSDVHAQSEQHELAKEGAKVSETVLRETFV